MIPALTDLGTSFKGAAAYYLHDKREEGEAERLTAGRVAWTETVNLATDDPERAWRMMADTAMSQAELKAAAGVKATGRKMTAGPVLAYSLSWHPEERPTREEQLEAARASLVALGLEGHQALIVAHNDEPHAHVHIMVNRVNPENGIADPLSNSKRKLSAWALAYDRGRGKNYCPAREENAERRRQGEKVDAARKPRAQFEAERDTSNDNLKYEFVRTEQRQKDAQLYDMQRTMREAHARQWAELKRTYDNVKQRLRTNVRVQKDRKADEIKEAAKPRWRELFKMQRDEGRRFEARERSGLLRVVSMLMTYSTLRRENPNLDTLTLFWSMFSASQRRATFDRQQEVQRRQFAKQIRDEINTAQNRIEEGAAQDFARLRHQYGQQGDQLRATQDQQWKDVRRAWQKRNAERRQAYEPFNSRAQRMRQGQRQGRGGRSIHSDEQHQPQRPSGPRPS